MSFALFCKLENNSKLFFYKIHGKQLCKCFHKVICCNTQSEIAGVWKNLQQLEHYVPAQTYIKLFISYLIIWTYLINCLSLCVKLGRHPISNILYILHDFQPILVALTRITCYPLYTQQTSFFFIFHRYSVNNPFILIFLFETWWQIFWERKPI